MELYRRSLITVAEAARVLGVNSKVLGRWIHDGRIRAVNLGKTGGRKTLRVDPNEIDLFIKKRSNATV